MKYHMTTMVHMVTVARGMEEDINKKTDMREL
jgi:hypothetical protein